MTPGDRPELPTALRRIEEVADDASFRRWDHGPEAVLTGEVMVDGQPLAIVAGEFGFLGGSIGEAAGERVASAFDRATKQEFPLLAITASGGTRLQEGTSAFLQMLKVTAAVLRFRAAGLLYVVYLTHPTAGGVLASWGSLGSVTLAEPGAFLGFSGPRATAALGGSIGPGIQEASNLAARGLVDGVVAPGDLRERVARLVRATARRDRRDATVRPRPSPLESRSVDAWESVLATRRSDRPGGADVLAAIASDVTYLEGSADHRRPVMTCIGRVAGSPAVLVAHDRRAPGGARVAPPDLRRAHRAFRLAAQVRAPLITIIDTPGAELSDAAEEDGLSAEISRSIAELLSLETPTLAVLLGEGGGGAALAMLPADRVVAAEHAWLAAIAPEGASAILYRTTGRAADLARAQGISSPALSSAGIVDELVAEPAGGATRTDQGFLAALAEAVVRNLVHVLDRGGPRRIEARRDRYRRVVPPGSGRSRPEPGVAGGMEP